MDDLSGLSWNSPPPGQTRNPPSFPASNPQYGHLRPTPPVSGRSTPLTGQTGRSNPPSKPSTPANDSFSNLVSFSSSSQTKNLSLLEQQKRLQEEKARQDAQKREQLDAQFGGNNAQFWDTLGQSSSKSGAGTLAQGNGYLGAGNQVSGGSGSAASLSRGPSASSHAASEEGEDILAAFNASAPVDASTNFPIPSSTNSPQPTPRLATGSSAKTPDAFPDDDDPFGLGGMSSKPTYTSTQPQSQPAQDDDDDVLGLLSKPVSEFSKPEPPRPEPVNDGSPVSASPPPGNPVDRSIAELVDMGFPADKSREALANTESGTDVQAAVGWLLNQAHAESRQKGQANRATPDIVESRDSRTGSRDRGAPSWMRDEERSTSATRRQDNRSPATVERDAAKIAAGIGNNLFKTANTLWKTGSKRVQQAVNEFQGESDPSQPRWMREVASDSGSQTPERTSETGRPSAQAAQLMTDEALLLETGQARPSKPRRQREEASAPEMDNYKGRSSPMTPDYGDRQAQQPAFLRQPQQQQPQRPSSNPRSRLNREAIDEQSSHAYISPARRKKQSTPKPQASEPEPDLLDNSASRPASRPTSRPATRLSPSSQPRPSKPSSPMPARPKVPPRNIPQVSPSSLQSSHQHREKGSEAYKRGDYSTAHQCYSTSLSHLPDKHPVTIILLCNRALTGIKIGEPKSAVADADTAIAVIGPSKGEAEKIDLGNGQPSKDMREFFGKALMRKAEALEQMERWKDAAAVWKEAVESSHGGSASIQGRNRCEKAAGISTSKPASRPAAPPKKKPAAPPKASALDDLSGRPSAASGTSAEAVNRLRAANDAADRVDNEKFALADSVDARLTAWKGGKQDNLRALLGSLDTVLWPEAQWKKISMAELVLPNKVKIQYMKGIGKVHPDKIPTDATTEQRMIAGAVFSTLNEAWDKFKRENGL
ncbi:hypothetical protein FQN54_005361 [Arachnomyces sp. PD_36]|nr:hypothetical protein FQN54_005361 [Arachnomyces sp. PD_36]